MMAMLHSVQYITRRIPPLSSTGRILIVDLIIGAIFFRSSLPTLYQCTVQSEKKEKKRKKKKE